jgi:hypothetical protein
MVDEVVPFDLGAPSFNVTHCSSDTKHCRNFWNATYTCLSLIHTINGPIPN